MEEHTSPKWPWWLVLTFALGIGTYLGVILFTGGFQANLVSMVFDAALFFLLLYVWLIFFSQFVLPVQTFEERRKILDRLLAYLGGRRGPAIFVRDGEVVASPEELHRRGPGVIWLDTASGAVTRAGAAFRQVLGPGVNFTAGNEYITKDDVVDLHIQVQKIGPGEQEDPFQPGDQNPGAVEAIQERGLKVSGLTRDGIEVIPTIEVVFRLDTGEVKKGERGSLFGYSKEPVRERADKAAFERAIIGQAVNPNQFSDTDSYQVAWNELPAYLAADLWREYLSKFKLDELFNVEIVPPKLEHVTEFQVPENDLTQLSNPVEARQQGLLEDTLTGMLHGINAVLKGYTPNGGDQAAGEINQIERGEQSPQASDRVTILEFINLMVRERLMSEHVPILNREGKVAGGHHASREYRILKERGIRVLDLGISDLRLPPDVEKHLESKWTATWLTNARKEKEYIDTRLSYAAISGQQRAISEYALNLSRHLLDQKHRAINLKETARILLMRSRQFLVRHDRAHHVAGKEREELEEIIQWVEMDPK